MMVNKKKKKKVKFTDDDNPTSVMRLHVYIFLSSYGVCKIFIYPPLIRFHLNLFSRNCIFSGSFLRETMCRLKKVEERNSRSVPCK